VKPARRALQSVIVIAAIGFAGCSNALESVSSLPSPPANNGQSIFQTGKDSRGTQIAASKPPLYRSCAACHRADGSGGMRLPGGAVSADLRHASLVVKQKHPYTVATLERAISTGVDNEGKTLSPVMPRWKLSKKDLHDVAVYVLSQLR
jgi:mono/diheme cytochrome c family protein